MPARLPEGYSAPEGEVAASRTSAREEKNGMDFFEQWFHWDPDHGNGSLEAAIIVLVIALVLFALCRHQLASLWRWSRRR
jgi:hypothetical protein